MKKLHRGDVVRYTGKYEPLKGLMGTIESIPGDVIEGITDAGYTARFKDNELYAIKPHDVRVLKRARGVFRKYMKYSDKAKRWTIGTGEIFWKAIPDKKNIIRCIAIQEVTMRLDGTFTGQSSVFRANISILPLSKGFRVILFQGMGHKDTTRTVSRWVDVRNLVMNHLRKIDKHLERPVSKFEFPSLIDIKRLHPPVKVGDLVVILSTDGVENRYGWLGIVRKDLSNDRYDIQVKTIHENGYLATYSRNDIEVIDHDEDLLKEAPKSFLREFIQSPYDMAGLPKQYSTAEAWVRQQARELDPSVTDDWSITDCTRVISNKLYQASDMKIIMNLEPEKFEENGYEYWLEKSDDNGLYLHKKCKTCGSLHPRIVRQII